MKVCIFFLGETALDIAIGYDYTEIAEFLKEVGKLAFSIQVKNDFGLLKVWQDKEYFMIH